MTYQQILLLQYLADPRQRNVNITLTPGGREAVAAALAELDAFQAAGDALAAAVRGQDLAGPGTWREQLDAALAGWDTARGGSDAAQGDTAPSEPPPDEPAIRAVVRAYLLAEFLPGEDPAELTDDAPLVTGGILDERGVYRVHRYLADTFGVHLPADRFPWASFDSVAAIARMVRERLTAGGCP